MKVDLLHCGPIRHVPSRAREPRTSFVPMRTRIRIRELARGDVSEGPNLGTSGNRRLETRVVDGAAWRLVGADDGRGTGGRTAPSPDAFAEWLAGEAGAAAERGRGDMGRCFAGTPVVGRPFDQAVNHRPHGAWDPARTGLVLCDLRDAAEASVRKLFERDVALVDGVPMMRMRGPMAYREGVRWLVVRYPGAWSAKYHEAQGLFRRLSEVEVRPGPSRRPFHGNVAWDPEAVAGLRVRGDEDVAAALCNALLMLAWWSRHAGWPDPTPGGTARRDRLLDLAAAASCGLLPDEDLPGICGEVLGACATLRDRGRNLTAQHAGLEGYLGGYALPLLARREADAGPDVDALMALSPR